MNPWDLRMRWIQGVYLVIAASALACAGCLVVAAGAAAGGGVAAYAYFKGNICDMYAANLNDAFAATRTALSELSMPIETEAHTAAGGSIQAHTADGERVLISLDPLDDRSPGEGPLTRICVRVATFGDQPLSERILYQVGSHLAAGPAPGQSVPPATATLGPIQGIPKETAPPPLLAPQTVSKP